MPCFKGLAVSIHTPDGPISEFSVQRQARQGRIACYIPVPPPKLNPDTSRPEQSTFAISITLLTPGAIVPYSRPQPTSEDPFPRQKTVGGFPGTGLTRGVYEHGINPYVPLTPSPNETVAAYIHFDGRQKEEVATLLRKGVETWVNSRWVSVPQSEGGGLAEREFLFREVGLERWLNGLDLEGETQDKAARIERRKQRLNKKRQKRQAIIKKEIDSDDEEYAPGKNDVLSYNNNKGSQLEQLLDDNDLFSSDSDSDDDAPVPEAAGQIKVSLFRVVASGEIKRGEYSPQFDAHDDDEGMQEQNGDGHCDADVDHTTTFAKPKTLDPKTISTQTVTGIDPPDKPYATFTFFYRGQKQLQKMGILPTPQATEQKPTSSKRKSRQIDFASLGPLEAKGTVGFAGYRDSSGASPSMKNGVKKDPDEMDSDADDDEGRPNGGVNIKDEAEDETAMEALSAEEFARRAELAEGVKKMQLKRQHSFDNSATGASRKHQSVDETNNSLGNISSGMTPTNPEPASASAFTNTTTPNPAQSSTTTPRLLEPEVSDLIGSPFKRHRASVAAADLLGALPGASASSPFSNVGLGIQQERDAMTSPLSAAPVTPVTQEAEMKDEEL